MVCGGLALDLTPLLVAHERSPRGIPRRLVRPLEQIDEFEAPVARALPHVEDAEAVVAHETGGVIPEARVECLAVVFEDLVDPELVDHRRPPKLRRQSSAYSRAFRRMSSSSSEIGRASCREGV